MEMNITVRSFEDVRALVDLATAQPFRVWISDGRQTADAKSMMCIFSLDLCQPLTLRLDCGEEGNEALQQFRQRFGT
ncbi:MAG: HPr family phosphocarrier protein [Oscillospiraceae bacterium]|nr:HPr family phosphocarrier protein [Oscillospiraceae bacterium]